LTINVFAKVDIIFETSKRLGTLFASEWLKETNKNVEV
jgi:hypothetical protein